MPERVDIRDIANLARSIAFVTLAHTLEPVRAGYLNLRQDEFRNSGN